MAVALRTGDRLTGTQQAGPRYQTGVNVIAQFELQPVTAAEIPGGGDTGGKHLPRTLAHGDLIRQIIRSRGRFLLRIEHHVNVGVNQTRDGCGTRIADHLTVGTQIPGIADCHYF
jgi:hypothetical protein